MNRDEIDAMLADALGGELDPSQRGRFDQLLAEDPRLADEFGALQRALVALRSLNDPVSIRERASAPSSRAVAVHWRAGMRYAAVIGMAFVAGFAVRAMMPGGSKVPPVTPPAAESPAAWEQRFADVYLLHPSESSLARSLVAVAHLTSRDTPPAKNGP